MICILSKHNFKHNHQRKADGKSNGSGVAVFAFAHFGNQLFHDHILNFEQRAPSGLSILGDGILASVGVNGLNGFDLTWHNFKESSESIAPISLEEAVSMANSTRMAKATLLYADLVYSNWVTENEEYNLSWYLVTDQGSYVVDCVELKHKCDSYEY